MRSEVALGLLVLLALNGAANGLCHPSYNLPCCCAALVCSSNELCFSYSGWCLGSCYPDVTPYPSPPPSPGLIIGGGWGSGGGRGGSINLHSTDGNRSSTLSTTASNMNKDNKQRQNKAASAGAAAHPQPQREPPEVLATTDLKLLYAHYINKGMLHIKEGTDQGCRGILVGLAGSAYGHDAVVIEKLGAALVSTDDGSGTMKIVGGGKEFLAKALDAGLVVSIVKSRPETVDERKEH